MLAPPELVEDKQAIRTQEIISRRERIELTLHSAFAASGTASQILILNGALLVPGNIYIVQLTVAYKRKLSSLFLYN